MATILDNVETVVCGEKKGRGRKEVSGNLLQLSH